MRQTLEERSIYAAMPGPSSAPYKTIPLRLVSLGTFAVFVAWLAAACYALAYLVSH